MLRIGVADMNALFGSKAKLFRVVWGSGVA